MNWIEKHIERLLDHVCDHPGRVLVMWCLLLTVLILMTGCFSIRPVDESPPTSPPAPESSLSALSHWAVWMGGAGLLLAAVASVLAPPGLRARVATLATAAGALIAGGWLLGWIDRYLAVIMICALVLAVLAAAAWLWGRRAQLIESLEDWTNLDIDNDGAIGDPEDSTSTVKMKALSPKDLGWTHESGRHQIP